MSQPAVPESSSTSQPVVSAPVQRELPETASPTQVWRDLQRDAGAGNDPDAVLQTICSTALRLFPAASGAALYLVSGEGVLLRAALAASGRSTVDLPAASPTAHQVAAVVARTTGLEPRIVPDFNPGATEPQT